MSGKTAEAKEEPTPKEDKTPGGNKQLLIATLIKPPTDANAGLLFQDTTGVPYVIDRFGHTEEKPGVIEVYPNPRACIAIGTTEWADLLQRQWWYRSQTPMPSTAMTEVTSMVAAFARKGDRPVHHVYRRVGEDENKNIVIDIGGGTNRVVVCTPKGWTVESYENTTVWFQRSHKALPIPVTGGNIDMLRKHINVASDEDFHLVIAWELAALRPNGPYPITLITGEAGSAKTTLARRQRALVDPTDIDVRGWPNNDETIAIASTKQWVLAYDNLSAIRQQASDMLSQMSTGGTYSARTLYSNTGETTISLQHPVILTSVADVVTKPDLMDRALLIELSPPNEGDYIPEEELDPAFEAEAPLIFGALLDVVCAALANYPNVGKVRKLHLPRMADFAKWMVAASPALGWPEGYFLRIYGDNRAKGTAVALDSNPWTASVISLVNDFFRNNPEADEYTPQPQAMADLLSLNNVMSSNGRPFSGKTLTSALKELAGSLRKEAGINWKVRRSNSKRLYSFTLTSATAPTPTPETHATTEHAPERDHGMSVSEEMEAIFARD